MNPPHIAHQRPELAGSGEHSPAVFEKLPVMLQSPESPRWHQDAFWYCDYAARTVNRMVPGQAPEVVLTMEGTPSALGFMPDDSLIIAGMHQKKLFRYHDGALFVHAEIPVRDGDWMNDMVVDGDGRAYVGIRSTKVSPAVHHREPGGPDSVVIVEPDGKRISAIEDICSPNGSTVSPDGRTFTLCEIYARRILQFDRDQDGRLSNKRVLVQFERTWPDGLALDAQGAVWACSPYSGEVVRVLANGDVDQRYQLPGAVASILGGEDRRTLFVVATDVRHLPSCDPSRLHGSLYQGPGRETGCRSAYDPGEVDTSAMLVTRVDVPGAGWP